MESLFGGIYSSYVHFWGWNTILDNAHVWDLSYMHRDFNQIFTFLFQDLAILLRKVRKKRCYKDMDHTWKLTNPVIPSSRCLLPWGPSAGWGLGFGGCWKTPEKRPGNQPELHNHCSTNGELVVWDSRCTPVSKWLVTPFTSHLGHLGGEQPYLGDLLTMVLSHLLNGMILQVSNNPFHIDCRFKWIPMEFLCLPRGFGLTTGCI